MKKHINKSLGGEFTLMNKHDYFLPLSAVTISEKAFLNKEPFT